MRIAAITMETRLLIADMALLFIKAWFIYSVSLVPMQAELLAT